MNALRIVKFKGNPMTLVGRALKIGEPAPNFKVVSLDVKEINCEKGCENGACKISSP